MTSSTPPQTAASSSSGAQSDAESTAPPTVVSAIEGSSYPVTIKVFASMLMLAVLFWGFENAHFIAATAMTYNISFLLLMMGLVTVASYWSVLRSRTYLDERYLRQRGLWSKQVKLSEITQLRFSHVPGLHWLIVPRVIVRTGTWAGTTFHAGTPELVAAFKRLASPKK